MILNPYANRWKALRDRPAVEAALQAAGVPYEIVLTDQPGHGIHLAQEAVEQGRQPIIAAGGDGSISEVVNGMLKGVQSAHLDRLPPLGIMPVGSANDLAVNLGIPLDLTAAAKAIAGGNTRLIDLGFLSYKAAGRENDSPIKRFFDNNSAVGLEPSITLIQQRITRIHGAIRYLLAALIGVVRNPTWNVEMEWDGGSYQGPVNLVSVGNTRLTGGLFYMTPHADPVDGKLTFIYGHVPGRLRILQLLPRAMKPGKGSFVEHPAIHEEHATWLRIRFDQPSPLHTDGEIQCEAAVWVEYGITPGILPVLLPR